MDEYKTRLKSDSGPEKPRALSDTQIKDKLTMESSSLSVDADILRVHVFINKWDAGIWGM